jgi:hypothetical protein
MHEKISTLGSAITGAFSHNIVDEFPDLKHALASQAESS